jgi:site-specific recombinase XerD
MFEKRAKRSKSIVVRLTETEYEKVLQESERLELTLSDYVRNVCILDLLHSTNISTSELSS